MFKFSHLPHVPLARLLVAKCKLHSASLVLSQLFIVMGEVSAQMLLKFSSHSTAKTCNASEEIQARV